MLYDLLREARGYIHINLHRIKWILLFGFLLFILFCLLRKKGCWEKRKTIVQTLLSDAILALNGSFIFVMTLFHRKMIEINRFDIKPFHSYAHVLATNDTEMLLQIIMNIVMCIPLGCLLLNRCRLLQKKRNVILAIFTGSSIIEILQYVCRIGIFELDDVLNNTLGAVIGVSLYAFWKKLVTYVKDVRKAKAEK